MKKPGRPKKDKNLANAIGDALRSALDAMNPPITREEAATRLGVSRDGLQKILNGDYIPNETILARAVGLFNLTVTHQQTRIDRSTLNIPTPNPEQLRFEFDHPVKLPGTNINLLVTERLVQKEQVWVVEVRVLKT